MGELTLKFYMDDNLCTIYKLSFHHLQKSLMANGFVEVKTPIEADILIAGLCSSFDADEVKSVAILDKLNVNKPLYVIGCMVALRQDVMPSNAHLYYSWEYEKLLDDLSAKQVDIELPTEFRCQEDYRVYDPTKHFIGLCTGCYFECSYCSHKLGAGNLVSRDMDAIINQVQQVIKQGAKTIVLTGIDTASYGKDIGSSFPELMENILTLGEVKYHIAQFNPEGIDERMSRCCSNPRITDLQLPIQTTSPRLLKLMNRNYKIADVTEFIKRVRNKNHGLFLRTDIIAGFPTESSIDFSDTLGYVASNFNEVAVYKYEAKRQTPIEKLGLPLCDDGVIDERINMASEYLKQNGCLCHSGGQDAASLLAADIEKQKARGCNHAE